MTERYNVTVTYYQWGGEKDKGLLLVFYTGNSAAAPAPTLAINLLVGQNLDEWRGMGENKQRKAAQA